MTRRSAVFAATICALALGGCTSAPPPNPPTSAPPRPSEPPSAGRTLDLGRPKGEVCALITTDQRAALEVPPQVRQTDSICEFEKWEPAPHVRFAVQLFPRADVLRGAYEASNQEQWQQFRPVTVAGQPAVVRSRGPAGRNLECEVVVGAGNGQGVQVTAAGMADSVDWCGKAVRAAEFVVGNLGG